MQEKVSQSSKWDKAYLAADKYITFNEDDPELRAITLRLPDPPDIRYIDGYGKPPEQQKFQKIPMPKRLELLSERALTQAQDSKYEGRMVSYMHGKLFWQILNDEADDYRKEIDYIKKMHWYLQHGYWCFIFGKPTWISPKYLFYLTFYYPKAVNGNKIEYRDEDRQVKIFEEYCDTTTETFKQLDKEGYAVANEDGIYEMIDARHRTSVGDIHPKRRRKGITMQACSDLIYTVIRGREKHGVIQADLGKSAEDIYNDHTIPTWNDLPVWLRPVYDGTQNPSTGIYLRPPQSVVGEKYLNGYIIWNDSAKEGVNDRRKIHFLVNDESAKVSLYQVDKRWRVDKYTMVQGAEIHGICRNPSTVEEMAAGGEQYQKMFAESDFYRRELTGMTYSGVFRLFRPVYKGWDGFIDEWGYSVIDMPTEAQLKNPPLNSQYHVLGMGSKEYWTRRYDNMLTDPQQHGNYRIEIRKHPMVSTDCWRGGAGDMGFNYIVLDQRLAELRNKPKTIRGNFIRRGDKSDWIPCDDGRFVVGNLFMGQDNLWVHGDNVWDEKKGVFVTAKRPMYPSRRTAGADPFDYGNSNPSTKAEFHLSKGGFAVVNNPDPQESHINIKDWDSFQIECYYENKPASLEAYCEDVLAACIWYGCLVNVESNKKRLIEYFIDEGFGGYLWYATAPDGTIRKEPGTYAGTGTKNDMLNSLRDFIEYRAHKCKIKEFLQQAKEMTSPKQLTRLDGLAACGWAVYASKGTYGQAIERVHGTSDWDLADMYEEPYTY